MDEAPNSKPKTKRWLLWSTVGFILFAIVVIVVVVPSIVVTRKKKEHSDNNSAGDNNSTTGNDTETIHPPFYAHPVSRYANLTRLQTYNDLDKKDRVFVIGDIHGCADEFKQLVQAISYDPTKDVIILAGDLVYRGPDNVGVIRLAKQLGALCVRGNHDDKVIRLKTYELQHGIHAMQPASAVMPEGDVADPLTFGDDHMDIVRNMTQEDYDYLVSCPLIIDLPMLNNSRVVHGGLDPNVPRIIDNDPYSVTNMRNIDDNGVPTRSNKDGHHWTKDWSRAQENGNSQPINVYYGHDASRGLDLESETFGTDSGCVYGKKLTALEIKTHRLVQVDCPKYSD